jgi:Tfp pilus assembly protein FimV
MVLVGALPTARELAAVQPAAASTVRVAPSDTLWSIAKTHRTAGMTTAETVERIMRLNGLTDATLQAGALISVPADGEPSDAYAQSGSDVLPN